jgi:predicted DNA-binding transcriptional regulator AlpA
MTLMLHAGTKRIDYDDLRALPTPPATETHVPIPHHRVVDLAAYSLSYFGHQVVERHFGVTEDGKGAWNTYSRTHVWRLMDKGKFPQNFTLGDEPKSRVVWWLPEIRDWLLKRASRRSS